MAEKEHMEEKEQLSILDLDNGSEIVFLHLDDKTDIRGLEPVWFNEWEEVDG